MKDNKHGFKAYDPGLVCRGYQYEEGKTYKKNGHGVCVGAAIGIDGVIKGAVGNWITLAEWVYDNDKQHHIPVCVKSAQIDGKIIKADTWYKLSGGEFIEVADE